MRWNVMVGLLLAAVMVMAGCGGGGGDGGGSSTPAQSTPVVITEANNKAAYDKAILPLNDVLARYKDAMDLAGKTSRIALAAPVSNLQNLKRETDALVVPACLGLAKGNLTTGMNAINTAFLNFMGGASYDSFLMGLGTSSFSAYELIIGTKKLCDFSIM